MELETYPLRECCVLRLDAGELNGERRLAFVLVHPTGGYLAVSETLDALATLAAVHHSAFIGRLLPCIECSPSYRSRLLRIFATKPRNIRLLAA